jgi:multidrug efflux system outer membrane protein
MSLSRLIVVMVVPLVLLVQSCTVGPKYRHPEIHTDAAFQNAQASQFTQDPTRTNWWSIFNDAQLSQLIKDAGVANYDLRIAAANLRQARALLLEARYDYYPTVTASGSYERQRASKATVLGLDPDRDFWSAGFDATWELDLFGRVRRSVEGRQAQVEAAQAAQEDVLVSVFAEVARNYFELRGAQDRLAVARRNAQNQSDTHKLTVNLLEGGRGNELDTSRAKAQLESTEASIPSLETAVEQSVYRLSVLTGRQPAALKSNLTTAAPLPELPAAIAIGNPAELLRRRPDVRIAERNLAAATARVGIATADLYPRIAFVGSLGVSANQFPDLFRGGADTYSFGPHITWAAFDLGRVKARLRGSEASADAELANFERTVLGALEETDGALVAYSKELVRLSHLRAAEEASRKAADLARNRFETGGIGDFLTVLDAQRRTLEAQEELSQSRARAATLLVAIFKALGGGWESQ